MSTTTVTRIKLPLANAYLVQGERPVLIDTGAPGDADRLVRAIRRAGVDPSELALILLTHGHGDHVGTANEIAQLNRAPVAIHSADHPMARAGRNVIGILNGMEARMIVRFVDRPFPPVATTMLVDGALDLRPYGVSGQVIETPGHTMGSLSVLLDNGDAIVGDLLMGGSLGGAIRPGKPRLHYFVGDFVQLRESIRRVLGEKPRRLLVGHGGPLAVDDVRRWWDESGEKQLASAEPVARPAR